MGSLLAVIQPAKESHAAMQLNFLNSVELKT